MNLDLFANTMSLGLQWPEGVDPKQEDDKTYQRFAWSKKEWTKQELEKQKKDKTDKVLPTYNFCINVKTGDVYRDDSKAMLLFKHALLIIGRPLHTCVKTLWHASIIGPLALEIIRCVQKKQTGKDLAINTFKSLADIVRTPIYGLIMTITYLVGVMFSLINSNVLYHTREFAARMERRMLRVKNSHDLYHDEWVLSPCLHPLKNVFKSLNAENKDFNYKESLNRLTKHYKSCCF